MTASPIPTSTPAQSGSATGGSALAPHPAADAGTMGEASTPGALGQGLLVRMARVAAWQRDRWPEGLVKGNLYVAVKLDGEGTGWRYDPIDWMVDDVDNFATALAVLASIRKLITPSEDVAGLIRAACDGSFACGAWQGDMEDDGSYDDLLRTSEAAHLKLSAAIAAKDATIASLTRDRDDWKAECHRLMEMPDARGGGAGVPEQIGRALDGYDVARRDHLRDCWLGSDDGEAIIEGRYKAAIRAESALLDAIRAHAGRHAREFERQAYRARIAATPTDGTGAE